MILAFKGGVLQFLICLCALKLPHCLVIRMLIRTRVNLKKKLPSVYEISFLKWNLDNVTTDSRRNIDKINRRSPSREFIPVFNQSLFRFAYSDSDRRLRCCRGRLITTRE